MTARGAASPGSIWRQLLGTVLVTGLLGTLAGILWVRLVPRPAPGVVAGPARAPRWRAARVLVAAGLGDRLRPPGGAALLARALGVRAPNDPPALRLVFGLELGPDAGAERRTRLLELLAGGGVDAIVEHSGGARRILVREGRGYREAGSRAVAGPPALRAWLVLAEAAGEPGFAPEGVPLRVRVDRPGRSGIVAGPDWDLVLAPRPAEGFSREGVQAMGLPGLGGNPVLAVDLLLPVGLEPSRRRDPVPAARIEDLARLMRAPGTVPPGVARKGAADQVLETHRRTVQEELRGRLGLRARFLELPAALPPDSAQALYLRAVEGG